MKGLLQENISVMFLWVYMRLIVFILLSTNPAMIMIWCRHFDFNLTFNQRDITSKKFVIFQLCLKPRLFYIHWILETVLHFSSSRNDVEIFVRIFVQFIKVDALLSVRVCICVELIVYLLFMRFLLVLRFGFVQNIVLGDDQHAFRAVEIFWIGFSLILCKLEARDSFIVKFWETHTKHLTCIKEFTHWDQSPFCLRALCVLFSS